VLEDLLDHRLLQDGRDDLELLAAAVSAVLRSDINSMASVGFGRVPWRQVARARAVWRPQASGGVPAPPANRTCLRRPEPFGAVAKRVWGRLTANVWHSPEHPGLAALRALSPLNAPGVRIAHSAGILEKADFAPAPWRQFR